MGWGGEERERDSCVESAEGDGGGGEMGGERDSWVESAGGDGGEGGREIAGRG